MCGFAGFVGTGGSVGARTPMQREVTSYLLRLQNYNLWHEDRTASIQGVETRVPFLDHRLVEFLLSIPEADHAQLFYDKHIERRAAARWLGEEVLSQPKVGFFLSRDMSSIAHLNWMMIRRVYRAFVDKYLSDPHALFQREPVEALCRRASEQRGQGRETDLLISVMVSSIFERMLRTWMKEVDVQQMQPPSPLPEVETFSLETWMSTPQPAQPAWWTATRIVQLATGVEILVSLGPAGDPQSLTVLKNRKFLTAVPLDAHTGWWKVLLSLLQPPSPGIDVAALIHATGQDPSTLAELLATLFRAGVLAAGDPAEGDEAIPPPLGMPADPPPAEAGRPALGEA